LEKPNLLRQRLDRSGVPSVNVWSISSFISLTLSLADQARGMILFYSLKGPGSQHASLAVSLSAALLIGILAQRSRFCTMGAFRDLILFKQGHLFSGVAAFFIAALATNLLLGQFNPGFAGQPIAHTMQLWNF